VKRPPAMAEPSERDQAILLDLARVRLLTGQQIERLHFAGLRSTNAGGSARRRTMQRLQERRLVATLPRRIGGVRAGSAGLVYTLDSAGQRMAAAINGGRTASRRRPWPIGWQFVQHTLDVAELYVRLKELERFGATRVVNYQAEPSSWYVSRRGHGVKPDAYVTYLDDDWELHRWLEVDRATESLPTLRRKLSAYLTLAEQGDDGPGGVLPDVLVSAPDRHRCELVAELVHSLPEPASVLISVELFSEVFVPEGRPPPKESRQDT
jgi:hypothetical protein